ncbi:MAG: glutamate synthase small subunit [Phycisphaerales bacterium]|jgi:indolepyruvate ferredoxin oxidoreductase|nr:glutamate synthase small subunit [Phycisphaerales bacterium]
MSVDSRFLASEGPEIFSGSELMLKGALETEGGVHLLAGYPGSPIAGFFDSMLYIRELLLEKGIRAAINNNEALAAAMLNGAQSIGCRAMIAMKSVGVHVAADALALGNLAGAHKKGGAIVIYGDDPWSDSTQVASDSRYISKHLYIPVIEPSTAQEVKDFVDLAFKISRRSELYMGYIITTNLADGGGTVQCAPNQFPTFNTHQKTVLDTAEVDFDTRVLLPPRTWWQEATLVPRQKRAMVAARELGVNRLEHQANPGEKRPLGFITSGLAHGYLTQALMESGKLGQFPILKLGMTYPVDPEMVAELAGQCDRIIVVEERRGFIEEQVTQIVMTMRQNGELSPDIEVWGKKFPAGLQGLPHIAGLHPSILTQRLAPLIRWACTTAQADRPQDAPTSINDNSDAEMDHELVMIDAANKADVGQLPPRIPSFCPGCPHRDSASLCLQIKKSFMDADYMRRRHKCGPTDVVFHGDIGCYTMLMFPPNAGLMHDLSGMGLGGGTGAGTDPFIENSEVVFMGDSTFFHSGVLAISQAIKLGQNITFIILDNSTTGMTGHQTTPELDFDVLGAHTDVQSIAETVRGLASTTEVPVIRANPEETAEYRHLLETAFLQAGVKVIIADKECGITRTRRKRRQQRQAVQDRGYLPKARHMNVNEEICRFCLACAELTGCPGLKHVKTDYGTKIDTDLSWCVADGACRRIGACNSFERITVKRKRPPKSRVPELHLDEIPEPEKHPHGELWRCCLTGVGGMGIGTVTSIVVRAGHYEGYKVVFLDKKGLAIRNGGVVSQVVYNIADKPVTASIPYGKADLLLGVDILEAARAMDPNGRIRAASPDTTAAVINTDKIATINGVMGADDFDPVELEKIIRAQTRPDDYMARDIATICEKYLGSKVYANLMMLGFAFQKGLVPVSLDSISQAISHTIRAHATQNLYAFNMGRKLVVQPDLFRGPPRRSEWAELLEDKYRWTVRRYRAGRQLGQELRELGAQVIADVPEINGELKRDIIVRLYDTMRWGGIPYAKQYADSVRSVYKHDNAQAGYPATEAVVHSLASAMLIKDIVFTAELATSPEKFHRDNEKYNVNPANGDKISYRHLLTVELPIPLWRPTVNIAAPTWLMKTIKRMPWLRSVFTRSHRTKKDNLRKYRQAISDFLAAPSGDCAALATLQGGTCMECMNPQCLESGCPLENRIPDWIDLANKNHWRKAADLLHETNNFPEFTARICPAPCQTQCKASINATSVDIRQTELAIIDKAFAEGWIAPQKPARATGKSVAVIGSGPAGLTAAQQLARSGHDVTVFERDEKPGGLLRYGVPEFRLEKELIDRRVKQLSDEGIVFKTSTIVGKDISATELKENFDAICLAGGATAPRDLDVPGRELSGIHFALDYLAGREAISAKDRCVVVIGGGDTGNDCVETALAQGAKSVTQLEIMPEDKISTDPTHDEQTGVDRKWCVQTQAFAGSDKLTEVAASEIQWTRQAGGANAPVAIPGGGFTVSADMAILAVGFTRTFDPDLAAQLGLSTDDDGGVYVERYTTAVDGIFAAGDIVSGPALVANAIRSGRKAAAQIETYLNR